MNVKILLALCISAGTMSLIRSQSCTDEGAQVFNQCGESCICRNGTMENCCRLRKDFTSMTEAERTLYVSTVRNVSTDPRFKDEYVRLIDAHQRLFPTGIHQRDWFLPWHRWYILSYENLLRRANCSVTLPYWDWSLFSMTPWHTNRTRIWYDGPFGLGGDGGLDGCVRNGLFRTKTNEQCLRRRFNGLPPDIITVYLTQLHQPNVAGFNAFELNLRVNLHDSVHCSVGGDMCDVTSANAPEFFLHHCFIDKIWANWQEHSEEHMTMYFPGLSENMSDTSYRPGHFINTVDLPDIRYPNNPDNRTCVSYEDPTHGEYDEIIERLDGMTHRQILAVPRHSFAPLNTRQMRFFNVNRQERRQARRNLRRELEPRNELTGDAGLTGTDRDTGFRLASLPVNNRNKRSVRMLRRKENTMRDRWIAKNNKQK